MFITWDFFLSVSSYYFIGKGQSRKKVVVLRYWGRDIEDREQRLVYIKISKQGYAGILLYSWEISVHKECVCVCVCVKIACPWELWVCWLFHIAVSPMGLKTPSAPWVLNLLWVSWHNCLEQNSSLLRTRCALSDWAIPPNVLLEFL
jgi:hypothetical protein